MDIFEEYLSRLENPQHRERTAEVLRWVREAFPRLSAKIAWNQPMFTDHGTFIIGFSVSKQHLAVAPEKACIQRFSEEIGRAGYGHSRQLFRIRWDDPVDYALLERIIAFNRADKAAYTAFWRK